MDTSLIFNRTELLVGSETMERYRHTRAIVFGVGGVGSWCAEGLIRSGIGHLTIVDADVVDVTNINRQIMATTATVGQPKAEVLKKRLLEINPGADIVASHAMFTPENAADFNLDSYDYVVDAIDSLRCKLELILLATGKERRFKFFSAMGALEDGSHSSEGQRVLGGGRLSTGSHLAPPYAPTETIPRSQVPLCLESRSN